VISADAPCSRKSGPTSRTDVRHMSDDMRRSPACIAEDILTDRQTHTACAPSRSLSERVDRRDDVDRHDEGACSLARLSAICQV
jgi:hypothetical protein